MLPLEQRTIGEDWGEDWGEKGFIYVEAGSNVCGLTAQAAITTPAKV